MLQQSGFEALDTVLTARKIAAIDGLLLDLGVSSPQLNTADRGFSFQQEGPLDMRMDPAQPLTAAEIVNKWPAKDLATLFRDYGDEPFARRYAGAIVRRRPLKTTFDLESVIYSACPLKGHRRIHPATRVFQALRIAVNRELESLEEVLKKSVSRLKPHGRMVVLSYHSLEDRRVKEFFRQGKRDHVLEIHTKKPLTPSREECQQNPRARSAKLRIAERRPG